MARAAAIHCSARCFSVATRARTIFVAGFDEIAQATAFKRDEMTTDLVCVEVELLNGESILLNEDMAGFGAWADLVAALPGADPQWREKVIPPPFAPNPTIVFARPGQGQR